MINPFTGPITGAKFFAIFASFFGVIIAVNLVLAYQAVHTFPGLEVANSYVASQTFDTDRAAQLALGWTVTAKVHGNSLRLTITDKTGTPVQPAALTGIFGRATSTQSDQVPVFVFDGAAYVGPVLAGPGNWNFRMKATATDGTNFQQRLIVRVY